jgi:ATP-dependent DNA helicase RecG
MNFRAKTDSQNTPYLDERERQVLAMLSGIQYITRSEVQDRLGVSQATSIILLRGMLKRGVLRTEGKGKNLKYMRDNL